MNETGAGLSRAPSICAVAWSVVQRHRMVPGALVGLSFPVARVVSDLLAVPVPDTVELTVLAVLYLIALAMLCWPWTSYALAVRLSLAAAIALVCVGTINVFVRDLGDMRRVPWVFPVGTVSVFVVFCAVAFVVLSGLVFVRMRFWPVYPPGHCERCGYDLFGLQGARCPECGTPFARGEDYGEDTCNGKEAQDNAERSNRSCEASDLRGALEVGGDE